MKKVILSDGTTITNCTDSTTSNEIYALRETYEQAGAVRDLFTEENAKTITVKDENDITVTVGADLVLISGGELIENPDGIVCCVKTRVKSNMEKMQDEIAELQEIVIEG